MPSSPSYRAKRRALLVTANEVHVEAGSTVAAAGTRSYWCDKTLRGCWSWELGLGLRWCVWQHGARASLCHWARLGMHVTPRPGEVDTWQPPRALVWDPVFQAPFKDSQGLWYPLSNNLIYYMRKKNHKTKLSFCQKFGRTPSIIRWSPCPRKTIYNSSPTMGSQLLTVLNLHTYSSDQTTTSEEIKT